MLLDKHVKVPRYALSAPYDAVPTKNTLVGIGH